jgi:hypothetical protein
MNTMRSTRSVRTFLALLVFSVASVVVGCGLGGQPGPTPKQDEASKAFAADLKRSHQEALALKKSGNAPPAGAARRGRGRSD